ncbi:MAG: hypothetical protein QXQ91_03520 [Nanopusillaceae archaeon]
MAVRRVSIEKVEGSINIEASDVEVDVVSITSDTAPVFVEGYVDLSGLGPDHRVMMCEYIGWGDVGTKKFICLSYVKGDESIVRFYNKTVYNYKVTARLVGGVPPVTLPYTFIVMRLLV